MAQLNRFAIQLSHVALIAGFFLVTECQNVDFILAEVMPVQSHITGLSEDDDELSQFRGLRERPANILAGFKEQECFRDGLAGAGGGILVFGCEKLPAPRQTSRLLPIWP